MLDISVATADGSRRIERQPQFIGATSLINALYEPNDSDDLGRLAREDRSTIALGFDPLDRILGGGLRRHDLLVLAGRPGVGKTIVTLQMARNVALAGNDVVFACFEHSPLALLTRLLTLEIGSMGLPNLEWYHVDGVRSLLAEVTAGRVQMEAASNDPLLRAGLARLAEYSDRLHFVEARPSETGTRELGDVVDQVRGRNTVLFVDYLQKVRPEYSSTSHLEHVAQVTSSLKELSLRSAFAVVAVSALSGVGLSRKRCHLAHLDGAAASAYDADVAILLNDKRPIVAQHHLMETLDQSNRMRQRVVFTVEKNRGGPAPVDVEFVKDFEHFRFDPTGSYVAEQLIEDGEHDDFRA